jgi:hypothetical protein
LGQHPNNSAFTFIDQYRSSNYIGRSIQVLLPEIIAHHNDIGLTHLALVREEGSAQKWLNPERLKKVTRYIPHRNHRLLGLHPGWRGCVLDS